MSDGIAEALAALEEGALFPFRDWPHELPRAAGVYSIWLDGALLYVGMAGRGRNADELATRAALGKVGLADRLASHASGRRSGDQFAVYVCDRLVLPTLSREQIEAVAEGAASLDTITRDYIRGHLAFRFVAVPDGPSAHALERRARRGELRAGVPRLNPLRP